MADGCIGDGTALNCSRSCPWPFVDDLVGGGGGGSNSGSNCTLSAGEHMGAPFLLWSAFVGLAGAAIGGVAFQRAVLLNWFGG